MNNNKQLLPMAVIICISGLAVGLMIGILAGIISTKRGMQIQAIRAGVAEEIIVTNRTVPLDTSIQFRWKTNTFTR